jgi:hypothetical protein
VRDRAWILPRYLEHVKRLDLTDIQLSSLFMANDCSDDSERLLRAAGFNVITCNGLPTRTAGSVRGRYSYAHLANLRNRMIEQFLQTDNEYLFSVDTDILMPAHGLRQLLTHQKPICSMLLCNQQGRRGERAHNIMKRDLAGVFRHMLRWEPGALIRVDLTGAVYLIHRSVLEAGVRYADFPSGEDIPFCLDAQNKGFTLWCDTSLTPVHVMAPGIELVGGC